MLNTHRSKIIGGAVLLAALMVLGLGFGIAWAHEGGGAWPSSADPPEGTTQGQLSPPDGRNINTAHEESPAPTIHARIPGSAGLSQGSSVIAEGEAPQLLGPQDARTVNPAYAEILPQYEPVQGEGSSAPSGAGG